VSDLTACGLFLPRASFSHKRPNFLHLISLATAFPASQLSSPGRHRLHFATRLAPAGNAGFIASVLLLRQDLGNIVLQLVIGLAALTLYGGGGTVGWRGRRVPRHATAHLPCCAGSLRHYRRREHHAAATAVLCLRIAAYYTHTWLPLALSACVGRRAQTAWKTRSAARGATGSGSAAITIFVLPTWRRHDGDASVSAARAGSSACLAWRLSGFMNRWFVAWRVATSFA